MGHCITNSQPLSHLSSSIEEKDVIRTTLDTIQKAVALRPKGWLGQCSFAEERFDTLDILAEEGVQFVADWNQRRSALPHEGEERKDGIRFLIAWSLNDIGLFFSTWLYGRRISWCDRRSIRDSLF